MNANPQRYRFTLLLFAGGILVSAALVASQITEANVVNGQGTNAAPNGPAFDEWVDQDPAPDEGKGKLLGHVERNGEMVEVREALPEEVLEPAADTEADREAGAERAELAPQ
ncbi:hypothetical protein GGQ88_003204 [Novosphingobium hassiacum]|uniref:Uncharacterized protein n=1 Tax=Novosphingobium hassiacum TaxID=173676 RepID=A0A7W6A0I0_9SPHN|nr:hypothetical protein [Novosphingobium hassiacum]MBB3861914.1 hypothetical protein [Novosphingobium hassiacum]